MSDGATELTVYVGEQKCEAGSKCNEGVKTACPSGESSEAGRDACGIFAPSGLSGSEKSGWRIWTVVVSGSGMMVR